MGNVKDFSTLAALAERLAGMRDGEFMLGEISGALSNTVASRTDGAAMPSLFVRVTYNQYYILTWYYPTSKMYMSRYIVATESLSTLKATFT